MNDQGVKRVQIIIGDLLHHSRAVNNKLLVSIETKSAQEASVTEKNK